MIFSISATTVETNTPKSVQDSLIKRFLRFVPDSMATESVIISNFKDEEIEIRRKIFFHFMIDFLSLFLIK